MYVMGRADIDIYKSDIGALSSLANLWTYNHYRNNFLHTGVGSLPWDNLAVRSSSAHPARGYITSQKQSTVTSGDVDLYIVILTAQSIIINSIQITENLCHQPGVISRPLDWRLM